MEGGERGVIHRDTFVLGFEECIEGLQRNQGRGAETQEHKGTPCVQAAVNPFSWGMDAVKGRRGLRGQLARLLTVSLKHIRNGFVKLGPGALGDGGHWRCLSE